MVVICYLSVKAALLAYGDMQYLS